MKAETRFLESPKTFWANVRLISEAVGYTENNLVKNPNIEQTIECYQRKGLDTAKLIDSFGNTTILWDQLSDYFSYRAETLNNIVQDNLMDAGAAATEFMRLKKKIRPPAELLPMNKQKGDKKKYAFLTGIVNMIIFERLGGNSFDYDPRKLALITKNNFPIRTLSRRLDGAYPSSLNPKVLWEIKEYYHTTTFGSRVADGVYESLLDGFELEDLHKDENIKVFHYLMVDAKYTWWDCGKSYLCRIVDMLNMGYVDEVLFGREVIEKLPDLVDSWLTL